MKHTILHQDAAAAEVFTEAERELRRIEGQRDTERLRHGTETSRYQTLTTERNAAARILAVSILKAAVVSSDELEAAEAMLHGMRLAVPQDEMGQ